jgi:TonB-linked SusC/RagA family outer membrane protein
MWILGQEQEQALRPAVRGLVLGSENNRPVPGIAVNIPGVVSAITDDDGRFTLDRAETGDILQLHGPGFAYKEVVLQDDNITRYRKNADGDPLRPDETEQKPELVILLHDRSFKTIYGQAGTPFGNKNRLQTAASLTTVSNRENYKKAVVSSESLLQDEGVGVNTLTRSGAPGSGANLYLRGFTSIYADNQPLILIDGVPYENSIIAPSRISGNFITPFTGIDLKDIENITVLKDATSIYGSKGANGVILIETSKATKQATSIDVHAYTGVNLTPNNRYRLLNAAEYRTYLTEILGTGGKYSTLELQALPYINREKPEIKPWGIEGNADYYRYNHNTDWQKNIFRNSISRNYYLTVKGGDDIALYALSVGYMNHGGIIKNTDFSRYNTQFNSEFYVVKRLKMSTNMNFSYSDRNLINESLSPALNPISVSLAKAPFTTTCLYSETGLPTPNFENADVFGLANPSALVDEQTILQNKTYRFFGNIGAHADIGKNANFAATFGVTFDKTRENIFLPGKGLFHEPLPLGLVTNEMQAAVSRYLQYYSDVRFGYARKFSGNQTLTGYLGVRYQTNHSEGDWIEAYNSSGDNMHTVGNGTLDLSSSSGILGSWKWLSFYLNGEYGYKNRYFLSYNMAVDGSSRFGKEADGIKLFNNIFGVFPSLTGAWIISSEEFMSGAERIEKLKLRLGYSVSGNDGIGNYSARTVYVSQNFMKFNGLVMENIANPALKWETKVQLNAGLDVSLWNERLNITFDVFQSKTKDLLIWKQGKSYYGAGKSPFNDGVLQNTGFELAVQGRVINSVFKWDAGVNISGYKNKLKELSVDETVTQIAGANILTKTGKPAGLFYGYQTAGVYATSAEAAEAKLNIQRGDGTLAPFHAGDIRFADLHPDGIIDDKDRTVIGDPNPDFYGSIINRLQWKRWVLNTVFSFSYGNDVYNSVRASAESMTGSDNQTININNRWSGEGHVTDTPRAIWGDPAGNARFSDRWIEDGSYIRLKSLSIAYDIPLKIPSFKGGLQVYATALNPVTWTEYLGCDPEFSAGQSPLYYGIDTGITPQPRSIILGIKLSL